MSEFYPIFLRVTGKKAVVIGGGPVAARKTASLVEAGARVTVISPKLSTAFDGLTKDGAFIHEARKYQPGDLAGAFIAVAATDDPRTNIDAASEADSLGIPINSVNPPGVGSFIVPSSIHRGGLTIAISTGGAAPALSRKLRLEIESFLAGQYGWFLEFLEEARAALKESVPEEEARRQVLEGLVGSGLAEAFKGDREAALKSAWEKFESLVAMHVPPG